MKSEYKKVLDSILEYIDTEIMESSLSVREKVDLHDDLIVEIGLNKKEYQVALEDE